MFKRVDSYVITDDHISRSVQKLSSGQEIFTEIISREAFIEAYNMWIKGDDDNASGSD